MAVCRLGHRFGGNNRSRFLALGRGVVDGHSEAGDRIAKGGFESARAHSIAQKPPLEASSRWRPCSPSGDTMRRSRTVLEGSSRPPTLNPKQRRSTFSTSWSRMRVTSVPVAAASSKSTPTPTPKRTRLSVLGGSWRRIATLPTRSARAIAEHSRAIALPVAPC